MNVRQMWKAKVAELSAEAASGVVRKHGAAGVTGRVEQAAVLAFSRPKFVGRVLGVDPSLRGTGLALVEFGAGPNPILLRCRTVAVPPSRSMPQALAEIHRAVDEMLAGADARHVALEQTIYVQNIRTAQILGAARGVAMAVAALEGLEVFEYAPLRVKQAVVGVGRASKHQMAHTVMALLGHARTLGFDEADAAGVAICHAYTWRG